MVIRDFIHSIVKTLIGHIGPISLSFRSYKHLTNTSARRPHVEHTLVLTIPEPDKAQHATRGHNQSTLMYTASHN